MTIWSKRNKKARFFILLIILIIIIFIVGIHTNYNMEFLTIWNFYKVVKVKFSYNLRHESTLTTHTPNEDVDSAGSSVKTVVELPEIDGYESILDSRQKLRIYCDTCALVSSSGHLKGSGAGEAIDNASCVIRTNSAPTQGFKVDVGSRTDIRVIGHTNLLKQMNQGLVLFERDQESLFRDEKSRTKNTIVHWGYTNRKWKWILNSDEYRLLHFWSILYTDVNFFSITEKKTKDSMKLAQSLIPNKSPAFLKKYFSPSTGWFQMFLAIDVCKEMHVYGMAPSWYCILYPNSTTKYHYYTMRHIDDADNVKYRDKKECEYINKKEARLEVKKHRLASEKVVFETMAHKNGNIHFHHPHWNLTSASKAAALPYFIEHWRNSSKSELEVKKK